MDPSPRFRLIAFGLVLAAIFAAATLSGSLPNTERVQDWADGFGAAGPLVFVPLAALLSCLFVPGPALAGAAGLLFGTAAGTPIALTSATLAAVLQFSATRYFGGVAAAPLLPQRVRRLDEWMANNGFLAVLYVRLTPGIPFTLVNYGAGLTSLRARDLAGGTAVGALPRTFAYVALGGSLSDLSAPEAKLAIALLVVFGLAGLFLARRQLRAGAPA